MILDSDYKIRQVDMANTKDKKEDRNKSGLRNNLIRLVTVPLLIMGVVVMVFSYYNGYNTVSKEVEGGLRNIASAALYEYNDIYDSELRFVEHGDMTYELDEAGTAAASNPSYIDYLKEVTGSEVTLFYYDIRIMTTISDDSGKRMNGTVVSKKVVDEVFGKVKPVFYDDIMVGSDNFYVCYIPVTRDGKCIGMVAAGKPTSYVKKEILSSTLPIILIVLVMIFIASMLSTGEARRLAEVIGKEKNFLGQIADGNLRANLDADILKRDDELGEMGKFTVHVQRFIRDMIERDTLTKLYTRRIGEPRLRDTRQKFIDEGVQYQLVMGDIDHFKRFNDTYGHDCGDLVLQSVAGIFNRMMLGKGYAVRWGGEEFIICFENLSYEEAYEHLCAIREEIIHHIVEYKDEKLSITMTFGIVPGTDDELDETIKLADNLLYVGKEGGRDRIVRHEDYERLLEEANMVDPVKEEKKQKKEKTVKDEKTEKETVKETVKEPEKEEMIQSAVEEVAEQNNPADNKPAAEKKSTAKSKTAAQKKKKENEPKSDKPVQKKTAEKKVQTNTKTATTKEGGSKSSTGRKTTGSTAANKTKEKAPKKEFKYDTNVFEMALNEPVRKASDKDKAGMTSEIAKEANV